MIKTNKEEYLTDLEDLLKLFSVKDQIEIEHVETAVVELYQNSFTVVYKNIERKFQYSFKLDLSLSLLRQKSYRKRMVKNHLYLILSSLLNKKLPWGSLTGVRPTKFARDLIEYGEAKDYLISEVLQRDYYLSKEKAELVSNILKNQKCIIRNDNLVDLYINIPICPTRCTYCSFISNELVKVKDKINVYLDCLLKELEAVKDIIKNKAYIVRTIYIGGGTPTVLTAKQLDRLLSAVNFPVSEFTVESGRADTITEEKLDIMKRHGVSRISINPQTFCEATLKRIGRKQKNSQILSAYSLALVKGFVVNMDIIAGLPGEKLGIFKRTINTILDLYPNNVTVHTLSLKNGAILKEDTPQLNERDAISMVNFAQTKLQEMGYKPYYLYRQKNQLCGLENVGYYRDEDVCIFNIDSMEETNSIIGVGAGAISKRVYNIENKITREPNAKFIEDYIERIDQMIEKKRKFFK